MKLKQIIFMKIFIKSKVYLILVTNHRIYGKVIGKMKHEFKGRIISDFVGLNSKMYSLIVVDDKENKKEKGVNISVVKKIWLKEFFDVLFNKNEKT